MKNLNEIIENILADHDLFDKYQEWLTTSTDLIMCNGDDLLEYAESQTYIEEFAATLM